jgi:hypothetical protein
VNLLNGHFITSSDSPCSGSVFIISYPLGVYKREYVCHQLVLLNSAKLMTWKVRGNENLQDAIVVQRCWLLIEQLVLKKSGWLTISIITTIMSY